jgi:urocanate hydratase
LWEGFAAYTERTEENLVELASDQTSLHNPFNGGYYPVQLSYEESNSMMNEDPVQFKSLVQESLRRHVKAVNYLCGKGMNFWDYGNAFLLEVSTHRFAFCSKRRQLFLGAV